MVKGPVFLWKEQIWPSFFAESQRINGTLPKNPFKLDPLIILKRLSDSQVWRFTHPRPKPSVINSDDEVDSPNSDEFCPYTSDELLDLTNDIESSQGKNSPEDIADLFFNAADKEEHNEKTLFHDVPRKNEIQGKKRKLEDTESDDEETKYRNNLYKRYSGKPAPQSVKNRRTKFGTNEMVRINPEVMKECNKMEEYFKKVVERRKRDNEYNRIKQATKNIPEKISIGVNTDKNKLYGDLFFHDISDYLKNICDIQKNVFEIDSPEERMKLPQNMDNIINSLIKHSEQLVIEHIEISNKLKEEYGAKCQVFRDMGNNFSKIGVHFDKGKEISRESAKNVKEKVKELTKHLSIFDLKPDKTEAKKNSPKNVKEAGTSSESTSLGTSEKTSCKKVVGPSQEKESSKSNLASSNGKHFSSSKTVSPQNQESRRISGASVSCTVKTSSSQKNQTSRSTSDHGSFSDKSRRDSGTSNDGSTSGKSASRRDLGTSNDGSTSGKSASRRDLVTSNDGSTSGKSASRRNSGTSNDSSSSDKTAFKINSGSGEVSSSSNTMAQHKQMLRPIKEADISKFGKQNQSTDYNISEQSNNENSYLKNLLISKKEMEQRRESPDASKSFLPTVIPQNVANNNSITVQKFSQPISRQVAVRSQRPQNNSQSITNQPQTNNVFKNLPQPPTLTKMTPPASSPQGLRPPHTGTTTVFQQNVAPPLISAPHNVAPPPNHYMQHQRTVTPLQSQGPVPSIAQSQRPTALQQGLPQRHMAKPQQTIGQSQHTGSQPYRVALIPQKTEQYYGSVGTSQSNYAPSRPAVTSQQSGLLLKHHLTSQQQQQGAIVTSQTTFGQSFNRSHQITTQSHMSPGTMQQTSAHSQSLNQNTTQGPMMPQNMHPPPPYSRLVHQPKQSAGLQVNQITGGENSRSHILAQPTPTVQRNIVSMQNQQQQHIPVLMQHNYQTQTISNVIGSAPKYMLPTTVPPGVSVTPIVTLNSEGDEAVTTCFLCGDNATISCCGSFKYCGEDCRNEDFERHQAECKRM